MSNILSYCFFFGLALFQKAGNLASFCCRSIPLFKNYSSGLFLFNDVHTINIFAGSNNFFEMTNKSKIILAILVGCWFESCGCARVSELCISG